MEWFLLAECYIFIPSASTFELAASTFEFTFELAFAISILIVHFFRVCFSQRFNSIPFKSYIGDSEVRILEIKWIPTKNHNLTIGNPCLGSKTFRNSVLKWLKRNNERIAKAKTVISKLRYVLSMVLTHGSPSSEFTNFWRFKKPLKN